MHAYLVNHEYCNMRVCVYIYMCVGVGGCIRYCMLLSCCLSLHSMKERNQKQKRLLEVVVVVSVVIVVVSRQIRVVSAEASGGRIAMPGCQDRCGSARIPYPFGIGPRCYHNPWFEVECDKEERTHLLTFKIFTYSDANESRLEAWRSQISWEQRTVIVPTPCGGGLFSDADQRLSGSDENYGPDKRTHDLEGSPFRFSGTRNVLLVSGCGGAAVLVDRHNHRLAGCAAICINATMPGIHCLGVGCCQTTLSRSAKYFNYDLWIMGLRKQDARNITTPDGAAAVAAGAIWAFLVDGHWIENKSKYLVTDANRLCDPTAQVVLEWSITNLPIHSPSYANSTCVNKTATAFDAGGFVCRCKLPFYQGNPYLPYGCQVVKECESCTQDCILLQNHTYGRYGCREEEKGKGRALSTVIGLGVSIGLMMVLFGVYWLYRFIKRKRILRLKAIYFERNGGLLLKQQICSPKENNVEKVNFFDSEELEKATDQYNEDRILGRGGQGTVYKGMLSDGKIVAIKKSKVVDESQLNDFINEVVLLSKINHRSIVNLLGCCLETEVPILVYEYVPSGTLSQHIHAPKQDFPIAWEMRLQIATDIANALAYLHSSYMVPIFHRDIKSSNILLDEKYRAKLSDFGISKSLSIDQTHVTTNVVGTFGYLDPEYFRSSQFTDKSYVYSFGVVLVELLTGQKAIRSKEDEERGLVAWFLGHIGDSKLYESLDARVVREGREEEILVFANLARRCLNLNGKRRPSMKEVAAELETIRSSLHQELTRGLPFSSIKSNESSFSNIDISLED